MNRFTKISLIVLSSVVGLIILAALFYFGITFAIYAAVENWVSARLGLDYYLAQLFAVIIVVGLTAIFPMLAWYLIFGKQKLYGALALIGIQAAICLLVYTIGGNVCFDRRTGKPLCYYADTQNGRVWSRTPGFDPESGKPFKLFTREEEAKTKK